MNLICVDDEALVLQYTVDICREILPCDTGVFGFLRAAEALDWVASNRVDIALLDIDMPGMSGLALAARIKDISPDTAMIFVTGYAEYAVEAFSMHVAGYLLKPVSKDKLAQEIDYALENHVSTGSGGAHISAVCFGNFDLFVDGNAVAFTRSKAKELFAYLIDRQGSSITRAEAAAVLWEDSFYDRSMQKQLDVVIRSLRETLGTYGIDDLLEMQKGSMRIRHELVDCDLYRFIEGDIDAVNSYRGEYMTAYSWAE
ncbi:MAG: response regulator, partial [Firmicutes bacterium]|nr:response regulator [Bacillota bacterium]